MVRRLLCYLERAIHEEIRDEYFNYNKIGCSFLVETQQ